jgi:hypothetical protein
MSISYLHKFILILILNATLVQFSISKSYAEKADRVQSDFSIAVLEDVSSIKHVNGMTIKSHAAKVELKRDFSHIISFIGQYMIAINDIDVQIVLPSPTPQITRSKASEIKNAFTLYPESWKSIAKPRYYNMHFGIFYENNIVLSFNAETGTIDRKGMLVMHNISSTDIYLNGRSYLRLELPFFSYHLSNKIQSKLVGENLK